APRGELWDRAVAHWRTLKSDADAKFDREVAIDARSIKPQVTWGTSPEMVVTVDERVPDPDREKDAIRGEGMERALTYMGLRPNTPMTDIRIDKVFIGSCTNSRIEDLRAAAAIVRGRRLAANVKLAMVVPGSGLVKAQAEHEGLDRIFKDAGFEWREPGSSMPGVTSTRAGRTGPMRAARSTPISSSTSRATRVRAYCSRARTSAAEARGSTRPGRWPSMVFARSSRRPTPTYSSATAARTACCRSRSPTRKWIAYFMRRPPFRGFGSLSTSRNRRLRPRTAARW